MLDFFLACVRKEPHLGSLLTFVSDGDAPVSPAVGQNLRAICNYTSFPNPVKSLEWIILPPLSSALWTLCKSAGGLRFRAIERQDAGPLAPSPPPGWPALS